MSERVFEERTAAPPARAPFTSSTARPYRPSQIFRRIAPEPAPALKWHDAALVICFAVAICMPLAGMVLRLDNGFVLEENRELASRPELKLSTAAIAGFPTKFEAFFNDQFGFRKHLIHWLNFVKVAALGVTPSPKVILGRNGWLFYGDIDIPYYRRLKSFSPSQLEEWRKCLEHRQEWLAARGIPYLIVIPPIKSTVYPELMPEAYHCMNNPSLADQFMSHMKANSNLTIIDLRGPLMEEKSRHQIYYRTDTHWNNHGAYVGYREMMSVLCRWLPQLEAIPSSAFEKFAYSEPGRDLALILGMRAHFADNYSDLRMTRAPLARETQPGPPAGKLTTRRPDMLYEHPNKRLPSAVMFRDSFANSLIPLLSENFSRILYSWQYTFDREIVERERPDVVIQEMLERVLMAPKAYSP